MKREATAITTGYLKQLTWLRGVAAFLVVISHILRATEVNYLPQNSLLLPAALYSLDLGTFGVLLFFTLSGTTLYISHKNNPVPVSHFYIKRFFRIWPAFATSLLIYIAFQPIFSSFYIELQGFWIERQFVAPYSFGDIIRYLSLSHNISGSGGLFNNAYWSLPVEFQYYLIFPLLIISLKYMKLIGPLSIGLLLYLVFKYELSNFAGTRVFMLGYSFCGGICIGYIYRQRHSKRKVLKLRFATTLLISSFALASLLTNDIIKLPDYPIISGLWNWYIFLSFIAVSIALFGELYVPKKIEKLLNTWGNISYSAYLFHNIIIAILILCCIQFKIINEWLLFTVFTGTLVGTYYVANLSFKYIESGGISVGRKLCSYNQAFSKRVN